MCDTVPAKVVVNLLHALFSAFDEAAGPHGVFKVDTIGELSLPLLSRSEGAFLFYPVESKIEHLHRSPLNS